MFRFLKTFFLALKNFGDPRELVGQETFIVGCCAWVARRVQIQLQHAGVNAEAGEMIAGVPPRFEEKKIDVGT